MGVPVVESGPVSSLFTVPLTCVATAYKSYSTALLRLVKVAIVHAVVSSATVPYPSDKQSVLPAVSVFELSAKKHRTLFLGADRSR